MGETCEDALCSRSCSLVSLLRSRGGQRRPSLLVALPKGLPASASTCWNSWRTEHAEEQGRLTGFLYLLPGSAPGFVQGVTCNSGKACTKRWLPERITATAPYG